MDAGVVSGTLHRAPDPHTANFVGLSPNGASKVPATLRVTAAQGRLHLSSLLDDALASPSSRFLASNPAALVTPPHTLFQHPARIARPHGSGAPSAPRKELKMNPILALAVLLAAAPPDRPPVPAPDEVRLTVSRDPYTSSDQVTLCRVRADNLGSNRWSGRSLAFEVRVPGRVTGRSGARAFRSDARALRLSRDARGAARPP